MASLAGRDDTFSASGLARRSDTFLRALLSILVAYSLAVWAVILRDWLRHPLAPSPYVAFGGSAAFRAFALLIGAPAVAILGTLILRKQRGNLVGLLLLSWSGGLASFGASVAIEPVFYMLVGLPIGAWWLSLILAPYYFPDGRAYPRWLAPILPAVMVLALLLGCFTVVGTARLDCCGEPANPFFIEGAQRISDLLFTLFTASAAIIAVGVFLSPLLRYRRAGFVQRQQIKAFAYWATIVFGPYLVFYFAVSFIYPDTSTAPAWLQTMTGAFVGAIGFFPPLIIAYAILRHRLFDIDVIIRRTLQYTVLTALLALVYFGAVVFLQAIFRTTSGETSPVAIVLSTLAIAALFAPLRRRVQALIDRRFYRRRVTAEQALTRFATIARDEVDTDRLAAALLHVVDETMQPQTTTLWVKPVSSRPYDRLPTPTDRFRRRPTP